MQKRDADPELMLLNSQPIISNPITLSADAGQAFVPDNSAQSAVNPSLFASNFLPLPAPGAQQISKKSSIPHVQTSNPVQLRLHSPNMDVRGIVPHVPEYGETVESIQKAQKQRNYARDAIPQSFGYPGNIYPEEGAYKKTPVPLDIFHNIPSPMLVEKNTASAVPQKSQKGATKRQYVQTQYYQQQYQPVSAPYANFMQQSPLNVNQGIQQQYQNSYYTQMTSPALQHHNSAVVKPIKSEGPCSDQYLSCSEFAKNNYCTNYVELMKIQCRKSCGHCIAPPTVTEALPYKNATSSRSVAPLPQVLASGDDEDDDDDDSASGEPITTNAKRSELHKVNMSSPVSKKHDILLERHAAETSGSGSGSNDDDVDDDSGSGDSGSSAVHTRAIKPSPVVKKPIALSTTAKRSQIKRPVVLKTVRSKVPHKKYVPHFDMGDFTLPVKKSHIPVASLALADKNDMNDNDESSGSTSGSGDEESGDASQIRSKVIQKPVKIAAKVTKVAKKSLKKHTSAKASGSKRSQMKAAKKSTKTTAKLAKKKSRSKKSFVAKKGKIKRKKTQKKSKIKTEESKPKSVVASRPAHVGNYAPFGGGYPRIDLKAIATALAKYEAAALELAGEYPKPAAFDMTEYQRSVIPHPAVPKLANNYKQNLEIARLVSETEREKKTVIPKYLHLSSDVYKDEEKASQDADSLDSVRQRFSIPGIEPTLNDYYSETGKINPFATKTKNYKKSRIEKNSHKLNTSADPYEYLRNMAPGDSMEPIVDPRARSSIPSVHSFPVVLMKVSPAEHKYKPEEASRRGKIHRVNAEGLFVKDETNRPVPSPPAAAPVAAPAPIVAPEPPPAPFMGPQFIAQIPPAMPPQYIPPQLTMEYPVARPVPFAVPSPPLPQPAEVNNIFQATLNQQAPPPQLSQMEAPIVKEQAAIVPSPLDFTVEQLTAPRANPAFAREEVITPEQQKPGTNSLRSKMLSAFFNVKSGESNEEGSGALGSGEGAGRGHHDLGSGAGEENIMGSRKSVMLHNLLTPKDEQPDWSVSGGQTANLRRLQASSIPQTQEASANYLQSNLAALTPENGKQNYEEQSRLSSAGLGASYTKMSKTQETNWMRPNPQSELASAMPESYTDISAPSTESAAFQRQPLSRAFFVDSSPSLRNNIPAKHTKKTIMQAGIFKEREPVGEALRRKIINNKLLNKNIFQSPSFPSTNIAIANLKDEQDKSVLMQFPKSPFSSKLKSNSEENSNFMRDLPAQSRNIINKDLMTSSYNSQYFTGNRINELENKYQSFNNYVRDKISSNPLYSWKQYMSFGNNEAHSLPQTQQHNVAKTNVVSMRPLSQINKQESSSLSARIGAAKYAMSNDEEHSEIKKKKPSAISSMVHSKEDQNSGWDYLVPPPAEIKPLSLTTAESKGAVEKGIEVNPIRKNLIKQEPELNCGDSWEGARGDFGTFCYKEMLMKASFDDALAQCRRLKADLFSVLNAYENRYMQDNTHEKFWIGYHDKGMDGNWNWTDGSKSIYTNWGSEADDDNGQRHDCVFMEGDEGQWKDAPCSRKLNYLCKMKSETCPKDWKNLKLNSANGCYKLYEDHKAWEDAENECSKHAAHLASLTSEDEQTMVYQVHASKSFWIGFNDRESEGDWVWNDRGTSSYTNWAEKSPNNGGVTCAAMMEGGKWHDEPCSEKLKYICKRKGSKPEKLDGLDSEGILLPVARLMTKPDTAPSHVYDDLAKGGPRPVTPKYFWPLLKTTKSGMAGNRLMAAHGDVRVVPGGVALDGVHGFLDGGDFHGKCVADPTKCVKGFAIAINVYFDKSVRQYKKPHCVVDTSGGGKGFTMYIANNKLNYKVITDNEMWTLQTDLTAESWQEIVMSWHKDHGISVYVNGAFKDTEGDSKKNQLPSGGTTRLIIGREDKDKGPYTCTKMVVASLAIFTKMLTIEDVPFAFTYGDTVVASYRWLMSAIQDSVIPGAPEIEVKNTPSDVDGGIYVDGEKSWLEVDDFDPLVSDAYSKGKHGFAISFKVKFDQRVREYSEPRYIIDSGGHVGGVRGISVYLVNDNLYFQVVDSPDEDIMIWKVRVPIYTVRWQRVVMTWRLDKGLWVYLDGSFRAFTKIPITLPEQVKDTPKKMAIGRKVTGPKYAGAQFAFGCLGVYGRYLTHKDSDLVFGGAGNPFPGIIREVWKNTPGENLTSLETNPDYPNNPSSIEIIENFDAPFNVDNNYGSKLKGYFIAPETGNTTFYLSCSKSCKLLFSADEESKNSTVIVYLNRPTWHNQWNKFANQTSKEIYLVAGKYYFLEAMHKGVDASDSLSVGVRMPSGRYQRPINIENLQWRLPGNQHAGVIREVWYNVPGYSIADLTSNPNFPSKPSSTEVLDKFDAPYNVDDNYGARISGYFHAPDTGDYRFYLASDSSGELWLSSDDSESSLVKVVTLNGWTDHNQWLKYPEQKSEKIFLVAGRYYFMRVYMKADKLGDCSSVAVELPSGHFEGPIKKKHLSWKLVGSKDGPGPKEILEPFPKPVGLFALNDASVKDILLPGENKLILGDVDLTTGPGGVKDDAFLFKGNHSSYIEIPNDGKLDVKHSITMLANIYPTGEDGPIINYKRDGWGVHLWQFSKTQLFVRFVTREGKMNAQPLGTRVLQLNKWNQVGASYDRNSGVAQLWHDGKMVKSRNIGQVDLLTNAVIRLGAREGDDRFFRGKISCVQIYDKALNSDQVGEVKHCPKNKNEKNESEAVENRIGEDTEEELIDLTS